MNSHPLGDERTCDVRVRRVWIPSTPTYVFPRNPPLLLTLGDLTFADVNLKSETSLGLRLYFCKTRNILQCQEGSFLKYLLRREQTVGLQPRSVKVCKDSTSKPDTYFIKKSLNAKRTSCRLIGVSGKWYQETTQLLSLPTVQSTSNRFILLVVGYLVKVI